MQFQTIASRSEGLYKEKGSKFIALATPVSSLSEVREILEEIRQVYHDARHHCYAYVLGPDQSEYRANDDGEPNHSAGDPILGQIRANNLTNILVVVIRYFGGTKLGVSGLINAYRTAASEALKDATKKTVTVMNKIQLDYSYEATNELMRLVHDFQLVMLDQKFEASCTVVAEVSVEKTKELKQKVELLRDTGTEINIDFID